MKAASFRNLALVVVVCVLAVLGVAVAQETEPSAEVLRRDFFEAYKSPDVERALELGLKANEAKPGDPLILFNLARLYGRSGNAEKATYWFDQAARNGFVDAKAAAIDPDLQLVRQDPKFKMTIGQLMQVREMSDLDPQFIKLDRRDPLLTLPPNYDAEKPAPLIVAMNGIQSGPEGMTEVWKDAAAAFGAIIVAPYAGHAYAEGSPDWGPSKDAEEIALAALEFAKSKHKIDAERVILAGFSQGGNMALIIGMRNPTLFDGIIVFAAKYDPWLARPPVEASKSQLPRVFLGTGAIDGVKESIVQADIDYRHAGLATKLMIFPETGHAYPKEAAEVIKKSIEWVLSEG